MPKHAVTALFFVFAISACTSATKEQINKPISVPNQIAKTKLSSEQGLKRIVAIGRFSDESKRQSGFLVDGNNNRLGKQASDILNARLTQSGKFILLERSDLQLLKNENSNKFDASLIGAEYLLLGSVSEFGRETVSEVGIFSRNKIQKARATVNVRLVNVATSEIIYSEEATGEATSEANQVFGVGEVAAFNTSLDDKAVSAAISKLVANIMNNLLDKPWKSYILGVQDQQLIIAGGVNQGLTPGTMLSIYQPGKSVNNPQTGKSIELPGRIIATVKVASNAGEGQEQISLVDLVDGSIDGSQLTQYQVRER